MPIHWASPGTPSARRSGGCPWRIGATEIAPQIWRTLLRLHISPGGLMHSAQLLRYHHLHLITLRQPAGLPTGERRSVMCTAPFYVTWRACLILATLPCLFGAPLRHIVLTGSWFPPRRVRPWEFRGPPIPWIWIARGIAFKGVPWVRPTAIALVRHLQERNNTCQCVPPGIKWQ